MASGIVHPWRRVLAAALLALLSACGGGGGGGGSDSTPATSPPPGPGESAYEDPQAYSTSGTASLAGAVEAAAVTRHSLTLNGTAIAYTARAGHLIARDPTRGAAEASMFYVAYTADGADPATRPVTFFYNGGPGSASVWLHLGSFGPQRLVTGVPATTATTPFPLVDNGESLLDTTDLVFVDAVGTGLSEAIAPFTNASFWGVDADAAVFRDAIVRWLAAQQRGASPKYLYGESYGGPRTAVLAQLLQAGGVMLSGLVLQSPALDYNSNCGVIGQGSCQANLPTYAAAGAWWGLSRPVPTDIDAYMVTLRGYTATTYAPAVADYLQGLPPPVALPRQLADFTGIGATQWTLQFNFFPDSFQADLLPGALTGRYDARMSAPVGSALAVEGDPSSTFITPSFAAAISPYLANSLRYSTSSTYVLSSNAIAQWNFAHAGRALPDTIPDLAAALAQNPGLRVLALSGYHDLATPFRVTELDLARLGALSNVQQRNYPGGHMSYLTDATRVRQKADLVAFYAAGAASAQAAAVRRGPPAVAPAPLPDRAGTPPTTPLRSLREPALQMPLRDPWVPEAPQAAAPPR